jgi:hypothetical protein
MGGECNTHGRDDNVYKVLAGKPEDKRALERPRSKWEDNIRMHVREIG